MVVVYFTSSVTNFRISTNSYYTQQKLSQNENFTSVEFNNSETINLFNKSYIPFKIGKIYCKICKHNKY